MAIWYRLLVIPVNGLINSFVDNLVKDKVSTPVEGSVVYCDLIFGYAEHSGIYIGNKKIVHLNKYGDIEVVTPKEFTAGTTAISIYVSCVYGCSVGGVDIAERAKSMVGNIRNYNVLIDNCHQFTSGCLTGDFDNSNNFLWMLKHEASKVLSVNKWRVWDV